MGGYWKKYWKMPVKKYRMVQQELNRNLDDLSETELRDVEEFMNALVPEVKDTKEEITEGGKDVV